MPGRRLRSPQPTSVSSSVELTVLPRISIEKTRTEWPPAQHIRHLTPRIQCYVGLTLTPAGASQTEQSALHRLRFFALGLHRYRSVVSGGDQASRCRSSREPPPNPALALRLHDECRKLPRCPGAARRFPWR